ncbi:MAG TPA: methyltransferase domain-containing protein [Chthoniobacterales bacterium]|nr:methyltransferase domain-containing protein [Chthoniobacterales bacterium]
MIEAYSKETVVRQRYAAGAKERAEKLCCPVDYNSDFLKVIPQEVIERDYGCGDPSRYLQQGEVVVDLGSGTGKICYIAAQIVGPKGKVIGVDMTDEMLEIARRSAPMVAERIGYANVEFRKGRIQDLALDLELLDRQLKEYPITDAASFLAADELAEELRIKQPLIASDSVDVVVSNCVLNLVEPKSKHRLFEEIFRVLKKGGRAVISDIVSDEEVPEEMQNDPALWSGCISGALTEEGLLAAFENAGFYGIQILKRDVEPWRTVQGIEFRSITIEAFKGKQGPCFERNQAVIYRGPFKEVLDDDNHRMERGRRYAVCDKTYNLYKKAPYREFFEFIDPIIDVPLNEAKSFDCSRTSLRHPKETKGQDYNATIEANSQCCDGGSCC